MSYFTQLAVELRLPEPPEQEIALILAHPSEQRHCGTAVRQSPVDAPRAIAQGYEVREHVASGRRFTAVMYTVTLALELAQLPLELGFKTRPGETLTPDTSARTTLAPVSRRQRADASYVRQHMRAARTRDT